METKSTKTRTEMTRTVEIPAFTMPAATPSDMGYSAPAVYSFRPETECRTYTDLPAVRS